MKKTNALAIAVLSTWAAMALPAHAELRLHQGEWQVAQGPLVNGVERRQDRREDRRDIRQDRREDHRDLREERRDDRQDRREDRRDDRQDRRD